MKTTTANRRTDKQLAERYGIPQSLRKYAKRYGVDVISIQQIRTQCGEGKRVGERKDKQQ